MLPYIGALAIIAIGVLIGFALALILWIAVAVYRSPYTPTQSLMFFIGILLTRVLWRVEISGQLSVRPGAGAVIVCNHRSSVDPFFIQLVTGRVCHWFVAREYFALPFVGWFLRSCGSIPTNRAGIDTASTKAAIRYASAGHLVGMLPEGRINQTQKLLLPARSGAALVALKARVPIIPCFLEGVPYDGTFWGCLFMPARVRLTIGEPIDISKHFDQDRSNGVLGDLTKLSLKRMATLAGEPDFEPELAGRSWKP